MTQQLIETNSCSTAWCNEAIIAKRINKLKLIIQTPVVQAINEHIWNLLANAFPKCPYAEVGHDPVVKIVRTRLLEEYMRLLEIQRTAASIELDAITSGCIPKHSIQQIVLPAFSHEELEHIYIPEGRSAKPLAA